jgi:hypothetical protein
MNGANKLNDINTIKNLIGSFGMSNLLLSLMHIYKDERLYDYFSVAHIKIKKDKVIDLEKLNMLNKEMNALIKKHGLEGLLVLMMMIMEERR